ncbi:hypothetical protein PDE_00274 [Penicillium oxalicum 114-2]|uniref:Uncharacterized protein n=1 Tax=Penicillium oxalicum (strain 114-2 / CGMCC 5302) TaxID=933388 RepID=S7Z9L6_PENO1|nr:hypothetical protein PDE_00274 [Penicillium oxalicum 114-2]
MESIPPPRGLNLNATISLPPDSYQIHPQPALLLHNHLEKRYSTISIPATYGHLNSGPPPGTVAGIVLGTVAGVILILYLTFLALNPGGLARGPTEGETVVDEEVIVRSRRSPSRRGDHIEVVEQRERDRDRDPRRDSYRRPPSARPSHIAVGESVTGTSVTNDSDLVEVIEEESSMMSSIPPRRGGGSRQSGRGYRTVDPLEYGGGSSYDGGSHYR